MFAKIECCWKYPQNDKILKSLFEGVFQLMQKLVVFATNFSLLLRLALNTEFGIYLGNSFTRGP